MRNRKVWDLPVRLFHWLLVLLIIAAWATQETPLADIDRHAAIGQVIVGLVVFRLVWGLIGSRTARFASFLRGPGQAFTHLRELVQRKPYHADGHNALGGWAVVALLLAIGVQAGTGLFTNDDIVFEGPLAGLVSYDTQILLTGWHKQWFDILFIVIAAHIIAVVLYRVLVRENLVKPMITGVKADDGLPDNSGATPLRFVVSVAAGVAAWWAVGAF